MRQRAKTGLNVGGSSILMIFVLLCMTTFATLSLVSANADYRLTRKAADATGSYYEADRRAEEQLALVDECLIRAGELDGSPQDFYLLCVQHLEQAGEFAFQLEEHSLIISYYVPVGSGGQRLEVELAVSEPGGLERYRVLRWQVINTRQWDLEGEDSPGLWDGTLPWE